MLNLFPSHLSRRRKANRRLRRARNTRGNTQSKEAGTSGSASFLVVPTSFKVTGTKLT